MANILIIGCGSLGLALAEQLLAAGHQVTGLRRNPPPATTALRFICGDIANAADLAQLPTDFDSVYFIVSPDGRDNADSYRAIYDTGLNQLLAHFAAAQAHPQWLLVSSTSVYAQNHGEWVDEHSTAEPDNANSQLIRLAEQKLLALNPHNLVVRFSGIYGPGREYLLRMAKTAPAIQHTPPYYTNRIHQDDCVAVLAFLLAQHLAGVVLPQVILASDDDPASQWEVISWLAEQLRSPAPSAKIMAATAGQNKRCNNSCLKALGYQFRYPSYKDGYLALIGR